MKCSNRVVAVSFTALVSLTVGACAGVAPSSTPGQRPSSPAAPASPVTTKATPPKPKPAGSCDPNYSGCVPIAKDVDCAGGNGNGPAYVDGPIDVIGKDIYGLDGDHDGIACE